MKQRFLLFSALACSVFCLCCASCKKENPAIIDFTQISKTDSTGQLIGSLDSSDWSYDAAWTTSELALLTFRDSLAAGDSVPGSVALSPAFPNPGRSFFLGVNPEKSCKMRMVVVDAKFQILFYTVRLFAGGPILTHYDLGSLSAFESNKYYRMYYGFYTSKDSLYYKGHGDLFIQ